MRALGRSLLVLVAVAATAVAADTTTALPASAAAALDAFRRVPWADRCKPVRGDPAPEGWQARVKLTAAFASLDARELPALEALLADPDRFVRAEAARGLGLTGSAKHTPALAAALSKETDKLAKIAMIEALGRAGGEGALAAVEAQEQGTDAEIRFAVGMARRQLKGGAWDVANLRAEVAEAALAQFSVAVIGRPAPELGLASAEKPVTLGPLKGKVVVLAFTHGDREGHGQKVLQRLDLEKERWTRLGVQFVVIDPHERERTAIWAQKMMLPYVTFASDPGARTASAYGVAKQVVTGGEWQPSPAWFVIDRRGVLVWKLIGRQQAEHASLGDIVPVIDKVALDIALK